MLNIILFIVYVGLPYIIMVIKNHVDYNNIIFTALFLGIILIMDYLNDILNELKKANKHDKAVNKDE